MSASPRRVASAQGDRLRACRSELDAPKAATLREGAGERHSKCPQPLPEPRWDNHEPWLGAGGRKRDASVSCLV